MKIFGVICGVVAIIVVGGLLVGGCGVIATYNGLAKGQQAYKAAWAEVENQYQRRADLIPNLVNTVKGYAAHEKTVFEEVTKARAKVTEIKLDGAVNDPAVQKQFLQAQEQLGGALTRLLAVAEAYPDLKASEQFVMLQTQLEGTENRATVARGRYIKEVQGYNSKLVSVWGEVVGKRICGFQEVEYFKADEGASKTPEVKF